MMPLGLTSVTRCMAPTQAAGAANAATSVRPLPASARKRSTTRPNSTELPTRIISPIGSGTDGVRRKNTNCPASPSR
ncbi:hypothetical protein SAMN05444920_103377 [Nonomuraea solani]|uniref:Uncharacterized protein n=1 Tax=Nonomuraea solani TaxID=1144553 RepID=A0A1H6BFS1_9ACTN|nr:hypothetical protein SAMN05444920_103377 [Nonomuraea solani]